MESRIARFDAELRSRGSADSIAAAGASCWLAWLLASLGRAIAQAIVHRAIVESETILVWLWARGKLRILQRERPSDSAE